MSVDSASSERVADSDPGPEGLLSLEGRILLFLYREGSFDHDDPEFARSVGSSPSRIHQDLEKLELKDLIHMSGNSYELTKRGRRRIRQLTIPRGFILASLVLSSFVLVEGFFVVFLGWPYPSAYGLLSVGVIFLVYSVVLVRYYFVTEKKFLMGQSRSRKLKKPNMSV